MASPKGKKRDASKKKVTKKKAAKKPAAKKKVAKKAATKKAAKKPAAKKKAAKKSATKTAAKKKVVKKAAGKKTKPKARGRAKATAPVRAASATPPIFEQPARARRKRGPTLPPGHEILVDYAKLEGEPVDPRVAAEAIRAAFEAKGHHAAVDRAEEAQRDAQTLLNAIGNLSEDEDEDARVEDLAEAYTDAVHSDE